MALGATRWFFGREGRVPPHLIRREAGFVCKRPRPLSCSAHSRIFCAEALVPSNLPDMGHLTNRVTNTIWVT